MSFDKEYSNRKDRRKPYRDARSFDASCRNHGGCPWCKRNRLYQITKEKKRSKEMLEEFYDENGE